MSSALQWSPQQSRALDAAGRWLADPLAEPVFYLGGYAGTGKTELARHLAEGARGRVVYAAYTGKAASVMRKRGCEGATTIHSLIYVVRDSGESALRLAELDLERAVARGAPPGDLSEARVAVAAAKERVGRPSFGKNPRADFRGVGLVVIDECSMVDGRVGRDLLGLGVKLLVLGDPFQLPPVMGGGFFTERQPDAMLTEVHRQAKDSPVLRMATAVRECGTIERGDYGGGSRVVGRDVEIGDDVLEFDQVLVGRNATRHKCNASIRRRRWGSETPHGALPISGDRLVCLRNDHDVGLLNGTMWSAGGDAVRRRDGYLDLDVVPEDEGDRLGVVCHPDPFTGGEVPADLRREAQEFAFGYALTVHKSQGSQWGSVLVIDESSSFGEHAPRHLYTAVTRAAEKCVVMR